MALFDKIRAALSASVPVTVDLQRALNDARRLLDDAQKDAVWLEGQRRELLLASDADRAKHKADLVDAGERVADLVLYVEALSKRLDDAEAAETDAQRWVVYTAAQKQADAAAKALARDYPKLCRDALALLKTVAEAQVAASAANADLPAGAIPIADPDHTARAVPAQSREIVRDEEITLWRRFDMDTPVGVEHQRDIQATGKGWGMGAADLQAVYRKTRFRRLEVQEANVGSYPLPLSSLLRLPALKGDSVMWGHMNLHGFEPALAAAASGQDSPAATLARLAEIESAASGKPKAQPRATKIEWEMLGDVEPRSIVKEVMDTTRARTAEQSSKFGASPFGTPRTARGRR